MLEDKRRGFKRVRRDDHKVEYTIDKIDLINFNAIKKRIRNDPNRLPILVIIPNIKQFPSEQLNNLIHMIHKNRKEYGIPLSLMIGCSSSQVDELHTNITFTNSEKVIIKTFYFSSMKLVLMEAVYQILFTK